MVWIGGSLIGVVVQAGTFLRTVRIKTIVLAYIACKLLDMIQSCLLLRARLQRQGITCFFWPSKSCDIRQAKPRKLGVPPQTMPGWNIHRKKACLLHSSIFFVPMDSNLNLWQIKKIETFHSLQIFSQNTMVNVWTLKTFAAFSCEVSHIAWIRS